MGYIVEVMPRADRQARIEMEEGLADKTHPVKFRNIMKVLKVVRIPIGLPIYRMKNGRTEDEQNDWLLKHSDLPPNYFSQGEENVGPQRAQHEILLTMSKDSNRPIYQVLEKVRLQEEPLLITVSGVVVNGNRRVAAMRDLVNKQPGAYSAFENIDAAVLPAEANELDLDEIEVALQMAVETKLAYTWINQRLKMRRLMEHHNLSAAQIAKLMNYTKAARVNAELQELSLVEEYLDQYLHTPRDYKSVAHGAQIFKEIAQRVTKKHGAQQDLAKGIAFTIVKSSGQVEGRVYSYRESFGAYTDEVGERLAAELGLATELPTEPANSPDDDPLADLAPSESPTVDALVKRLNDPAEADDLAKRIAAIHDSIKYENEDDDRRAQALVDLRKTETILAGIDLSSLHDKHYEDARNALDVSADRIALLLDQLDRLSEETRAATVA